MSPVAPHPQFTFVREVGGIEELRHRENDLTVLLLQQAAAQSEAMMRSTHADYDEVTTPLYEIAAAHPSHPVVQQI
ncbi:MAG: hypothetical protein AAGN64_10575, partial [Bacteroidota bacterium]